MLLICTKLKFCHLVKSRDSEIISYPKLYAEPHSSLGSVQDLRTGGRWFDP